MAKPNTMSAQTTFEGDSRLHEFTVAKNLKINYPIENDGDCKIKIVSWRKKLSSNRLTLDDSLRVEVFVVAFDAPAERPNRSEQVEDRLGWNEQDLHRQEGRDEPSLLRVGNSSLRTPVHNQHQQNQIHTNDGDYSD